MSCKLPRRPDGTLDVLAVIRETTTEEERREARREAEQARRHGKRLWAAMMLALDVDTFTSIRRRLPVRAGNLDAIVLRHALRGTGLPDADAYIPIGERSKNARRRAGLEPITLHEARHTFAGLMIAAGVNAKALATYMGHASVTR